MADPARNPFFERLDFLKQGQGDVANSIDKLANAMPGTAGLEGALRQGSDHIAGTIDNLARAVAGADGVQDALKQSSAYLADRICSCLQELRTAVQDTSNTAPGVAALCLAVDHNGSFDERSKQGELLKEAANGDTLEALIPKQGEDPSERAEEFTLRALNLARDRGFKGFTSADFRAFALLAPDVWARVGGRPKKKTKPASP